MARASIVEEARNGSFKFGIEGLPDLLNVIRLQTETIALGHYPDAERFPLKFDMQRGIEAEFLRVLVTYVCWGRANRWHLDFCNEETGEFGILLTGEYTCLVQCNCAGAVSGHS